MIPKSIQKELPFSSKPKDIPSRKRPLLADRRAVIMEPHDRKTHALVQQLQLVMIDKVYMPVNSSFKGQDFSSLLTFYILLSGSPAE